MFLCVRTPAQVATQHNDANRTGANLNETTLNVSNVTWSRFGHVATFPVDGDVYAQPLYIPGIVIRNTGKRDLVLVATANNTLFAFDANTHGTAAPLWKREYGNAVPMPSDDFANLEFTCKLYTSIHGPGLPPEGARINFDNHVWYNMRQIGITGTPVVDAETHTIYFVTFRRDDKPTHSGPCMDFSDCKMQTTCSHPIYTYHYWLHAVDVTSGDEKTNSPVEITGTAPATSRGSAGGVATFQASLQLQRPALLLAKVPQPALYIAFSGHGDVGDYHGWVFAYDLGAPQKRLAIFLDTPDADSSFGSEEGGIWQSGQGPVADADGNVYVMSGNGSNAANSHNYGDSFIKLRLTGDVLTVVKTWSPTPNDQDRNDNDLGSGGPLLVENGNLLVGGGKLGAIYTLNRDLSVQQQFRAVIPPPAGTSCDVGTYPKSCSTTYTPHIHGSPVYWKGRLRTFLYVWGENDCLRAYPLDAGGVPKSSNQCLAGTTIGAAASFSSDLAPRPTGEEGMPGGMLAVSANGDHEGSAIVWASRPLSGTALQHVPPGVLEAFDASNVARRLWASEEFADDTIGNFARFTPPTVAGGRVFMATFSHEVAVYGLLPAPRVARQGVVTALSRNSADASLYRVAPNGSVRSTWWDGTWHPWFSIGTRVGWVPAGAPVTPLSRNSSDASLYVVGNDGGVYSAWWSAGKWHDWFRIGSSFTAPKGVRIHALSRSSADASLYVVSNDGGVYSAWWSAGKWHDWFRIGSSFTAPRGAPIYALSRTSSDASLYVVGNDGGVYSTWWSAGKWHDWFRIGSSFTAPRGAPIYALSRSSSDASLYVVGNDGGVYSTWWSDGKWHDWFRIDPSFAAPKGAHVTALSRGPTDASLYVAGNDGVYSTYWSENKWHSWFRVDFAVAVGGSFVGALSRRPDDASLYVVGADGIVHSTFWNGVWQPWFLIRD
jgi:hypothetical protein